MLCGARPPAAKATGMTITDLSQITPGAIIAAMWAGKLGPELRVKRVTPDCRHTPGVYPVGDDLEIQLECDRVGSAGSESYLDLLRDSQGRICYVYPWSWIKGDQRLGFDGCDRGPSVMGYVLVPLTLLKAGIPFRASTTQLSMFGGAA